MDFSKAFYSVDRNPLFKVLRHYGIPRKITDAITAMYTNSSSQADLVNHFSKSFSIITAVLQGDTLAPFLFIIVVDCFLRQQMTHMGLKHMLKIQKRLKFVDFQYLGAQIASPLSDFCRQRGIAWSNFWKLQTIWRSASLSLHLKLRLFD